MACGRAWKPEVVKIGEAANPGPSPDFAWNQRFPYEAIHLRPSGINEEDAEPTSQVDGEGARQAGNGVFFASKTWVGSQVGMAFQTGSRGTGYYPLEPAATETDTLQEVGPPEPISLELLVPAAGTAVEQVIEVESAMAKVEMEVHPFAATPLLKISGKAYVAAYSAGMSSTVGRSALLGAPLRSTAVGILPEVV